jgi:hypothetical protein
MDLMPAAIAAQMAMAQQRVALSMIKQTAEMQTQIADILMASVSSRGSVVNIAA